MPAMAGSRSVLVIEPADDDRGGFADILRSTGVLVSSTADTARALAGIASNEHAMVIVDPATLGLNAAALVETLRHTATQPVVLIMIDDFEDVRRGFGADVIHGYIRRTDDEQLVELVRDCLAALRECGTGSQPVNADGLRVRPTSSAN